MEGLKFRWLYQDGTRPDNEVLDCNITKKDVVRGALIVRDEGVSPPVYRLFPCVGDFWKWYGPLDQKHVHEVVFRYMPQRFKFDIDAAPEKLHAAGLTGQEVLNAITEMVIDVFALRYQVAMTRDDIAVFDSCGKDKVSYHLVTREYMAADSEEAKSFTAQVIEELNHSAPEVVGFLDPGVNKSTQNFRIIGSCKKGSTRTKNAVRAEDCKLLVTHPANCQVLGCSSGANAKAAALPDACEADVQAALALVREAGLHNAHVFDKCVGPLLTFRRTRPSHCTICDRRHDNDNTLMVMCRPCENDGDMQFVELCRRAPKKSRLLSSPVFCGDGSGLERRVRAIQAGEYNPRASEDVLFETLPMAQKTIYTEDSMREYERVPTLAVKAQMKCGKTRALRAYLNKYYPAASSDNALGKPTIRFLTFRKTFSDHVKQMFPEFAIYSDSSGVITDPMAIVQIESLHRLAAPVGFAAEESADLVIMDEVESILEQFDSGLHNNLSKSFAIFQWLMQTARHVVCMDANLSDRTFRVLQRLRGHAQPHLHWNQVQKAGGETCRVTTSPGEWHHSLNSSLAAGRRIVVACNSLREAQGVRDLVVAKYPHLRHKLYSSKTLQSEKEAHLADVHKHWGELDVLIYTPTISAGVSFELEHFDELFCYFSDRSCGVEVCRQMMARVRNLRLKRQTVCIKAARNFLPTSPKQIEAKVMRSRGLLVASATSGCQFEYDPATGSVRPYVSPYFHLWIENRRMENLSRNDFARRFVDQVAATGARVEMLVEDGGGAELTIKAAAMDRKAILHALDEKERRDIANAEELEPEEVYILREARREQRDVTAEEQLSLQKANLRDLYDWNGRITPEFVRELNMPKVKAWFRNLCQITSRESVELALNDISQREFVRFRDSNPPPGAKDTSVEESLDLQHKYVHNKHRLAIWLICLCGFLSINDTRRLTAVHVLTRLSFALPVLERLAPSLETEFDVRCKKVLNAKDDSQTREKNALRLINSIVRGFYGLEVKLDKEENACLVPVKDAQCFWKSDRPQIPSKLKKICEDLKNDNTNFILRANYDDLL